jgi:membrane protein DedA with SNARE-associated domain
MENLAVSLHSIALAAGFWGILFVAFLQEVFPPLPSTAVAMSLGFLLFAGQSLSAHTLWGLFLQIGLPIALGLTIGAVIIYYLVAWGGMALIDRWGRWMGITREDIEKLQGRMKGSVADDLLLFLARAFPLMPSVAVNIVAGLMRTRILPFILLTFLGTIIRAMWAALIGWQVGSAFEAYAATIERIHTLVFVVLILGTLFFVWHRRRKQGRV